MMAGSWHRTKTSTDYVPALYLEPGKQQRRCTVLYVRLDSVEAARAKLALGKAAWVRVEDGERMRDGEAPAV